MWRQDARSLTWFIILLASALLLIVPFFSGTKMPAPPRLEWSPGYWEVLPDIGLARIVPFARAQLVNPATGAGPSAIREPATTKLAPKY